MFNDEYSHYDKQLDLQAFLGDINSLDSLNSKQLELLNKFMNGERITVNSIFTSVDLKEKKTDEKKTIQSRQRKTKQRITM